MLEYEIEASSNNQLEIMLPRLYLNGKKVKLIELFGGIGSQAKAFEILSRYNSEVIFEHYKLIEFDKYCIESYNAIHNTNFTVKDITKITYDELEIKDDGNIYILTYSFPCQDLSTAGKGRGMQKGSGTRSSLLWEVERILLEHNEQPLPDILLMENVPQVNADKNIDSFNKWKKTLESLGYRNYVKKINSKHFGIPQTRDRCFMVSILDKRYYYYFPNKIHNIINFEDMLEKFEQVAKRHLLSKSLIKCFLQEGSGGFNRKKQFLRKFKNKQKYFYTITTTQSSATDNYIVRNDEIRQKINKEKDNDKLMELLYNNVRRLTPKECMKLMGFSYKDYEKISKFTSETQIYKQSGNSIVVTVLIAIFSQFYKDIDYENIINNYIKTEILEKW